LRCPVCSDLRQTLFTANAKFSFDDDDPGVQKQIQHRRLSLSSVVATIETPSGPMNYRWVEINFYSFPFTREDIAAARKGNTEPINKKWQALGENYNPYTDEDRAAAREGNREALDRKTKEMAKRAQAYNHGRASLQLAADGKLGVRQVIMTVPGYSCTIAIVERDLKNFLQEYHFDGKTLRLKS
jgi:hypothetical protein